MTQVVLVVRAGGSNKGEIYSKWLGFQCHRIFNFPKYYTQYGLQEYGLQGSVLNAYEVKSIL